MNLLEKLMSIINKQKQAILFSQKDKEIIREISQCNNSYYKTKVLDVLQCELSDWSYDISKYMIKDKNRLIAEKSILVIQEFKRLEDFLNLFEQYQKDEFINYELIEAIGYIGIMRQLDDDIIEKRMKEILQNLEKKSYAKYRIYDYLFYITKNEKYLDAILNGLQSWDSDFPNFRNFYHCCLMKLQSRYSCRRDQAVCGIPIDKYFQFIAYFCLRRYLFCRQKNPLLFLRICLFSKIDTEFHFFYYL